MTQRITVHVKVALTHGVQHDFRTYYQTMDSQLPDNRYYFHLYCLTMLIALTKRQLERVITNAMRVLNCYNRKHICRKGSLVPVSAQILIC